ncbi:AF4/FMR2 family member 1-like isoform X3 [Pygocentrus nattereri]|uniref:AF4/FMR2 C-terminal homology domain-containing protein n=1 Tax=Pygocentrus nattereri TaxID=42514 RepID=A0AAR2LXP0_PYGNA|nr:AF4/FMR2 family member 1-like isoform X3 [Pygocentrus nattereri]
MANRATSNSAPNPPGTMAAQPSLREELNVLRRREWERRNQEAQQDRELYQENTPLFGEPYKTNKGDELSRIVQRMLGNYEDGNSSQYSQYDGVTKDRPPASSHGHSGYPMHKDKTDPSFQNSSGYSTAQSGLNGHGSAQPSKKYLVPDSHVKEAPLEAQQRKTDARLDMSDYATFPPVLPDLSPPAEPLSPLHSSESSDSEQDTDNENHRSLSPEHNTSGRMEPPPHPEAQKEVQQLTGDIPPLTSQTFPLPLSSKTNLANSKKPMALVRPMDGPDQVTSESPDLKPSLENFHGQSYEALPDLKSGGKPSLPPLKVPPQSMEMLSNEVQCVEEILREMTHSWPPLLTAIHTPSTAEPPKFSVPNKEPHLHPGYQQPQKRHDSLLKSPLSPCRPEPVVPEDGGAAVVALSSGGESGSSSDSESSSGSESDSEGSESAAEENPPAPQETTPSAKAEGLKDINWQLITWIKESQQSLNPQNHSEVAPDAKTAPSTKPQPRAPPQDEPNPKNRRHYGSHSPPAPPQPTDTDAEAESASLSQHASKHANHKPVSKPSEAGHRKTVGNKQPGRSSKAPRPEEAHAGLRVESVELTPRDKDATFTDRPKVKTKTSHKSDGKRTSKHRSDKKEGKNAAPKATETEGGKEAEPAPLPSPAALRSTVPPTVSASTTSGVRTETVTPTKSSKKSRTRSPTRDRKKERASRSATDRPQSLVVKIELSQLSRVPTPAKAAKASEGSSKKAGQEKKRGSAAKAGKKRPAEKAECSVPKKKPKLEKESRTSSSSQHGSKTEASRTITEDKEKKSSKKVLLPPHSCQDQLKVSGNKRRSGEPEESSSSSKHKKRSSSKQEHSRSEKKPSKSNVSSSETPTSCTAPATHRPLLTFEDRQFSVDHHMKEAKKLKHKADATLDKMGKAFSYLDAAMSFVESGIAMETDPHTPKSAYTMFSETVDLIRFILKLKNYLDPSAPASERDFLVLCMRCQALLQMAMFRCKRDSALKYSRTLTDHFKNSKSVQAPSPCISKSTGTPSPMSPMPSPASSVSSGPASNPGSSSTVAIPQVIQQVASSYVNITALFLSAHDTWEQAEELARKGSGVLSELDAALGQLSLTSGMTPLVRYTRQGLHWLKLDASNAR